MKTFKGCHALIVTLFWPEMIRYRCHLYDVEFSDRCSNRGEVAVDNDKYVRMN